jgi:hypothetical protein
MIINLYIYEQNGAYLGESSELCINSNIPLLASTPIEFWGSDRQEVIAQVKQYARAKFPNGGSIRLV